MLTTYPATKSQVTAPARYVTFRAEKGNTTLTRFKPSPVAKTNWLGGMQKSQTHREQPWPFNFQYRETIFPFPE